MDEDPKPFPSSTPPPGDISEASVQSPAKPSPMDTALRGFQSVRTLFTKWFTSPNRRKLTLQIVAFSAVLVTLWFLIPNQKSITALGQLGTEIGYPGFFLAQAILPLLGFPIMPFLVIGSFSFGFIPCLLGTAAATAIQLPLAYLIGTRILKNMINHLSEWFEFPLIKLQTQDQVKFIFFIKLVPGLSQTLRHYILAIAHVPFRQFFLISWSMSMTFSIIVLLASRTLKTGGNWNIYLALACLTLIIAIVVILRKQTPSDPPAKKDSQLP